MKINISEVISTPGKIEHFTEPVEMKVFRANGTDYPFSKCDDVTLELSNIGERRIHIAGHVNAVLNLSCDRCLADVPTVFDLTIDREVDFKESDEDRRRSLDEISYIEQSELDIDLMVYNEILLHFPMKTLCREDCKGLCLKCGHNLNDGDCGCDRESLDPRMSAIRDIFNNFKEV